MSASLFFGVNLLSECLRMVIGILCSMARPRHVQSKLKMMVCGSWKAVRTTNGGAQTFASFLLRNKEPSIDALWLDTINVGSASGSSPVAAYSACGQWALKFQMSKGSPILSNHAIYQTMLGFVICSAASTP
ncbi:hypothetical protein KP509_01G000900 [Ceratopteris richardii]|uniref:Uncharacterized protein n=1 Tax=Ceratopteris richardii TaxID=49495 RepID=A0A8T2VLF3_CERRI|nr:hypothetical protein KP509_01G000900 [Ceratopteris richardii]